MQVKTNHRFLKLATIFFFVLALGLLLPTLSVASANVVAERIDLIRHGESEDNADQGRPVSRLDGNIVPSRGKVLSGWNSASLTLLGVSQAVKAGEFLLQQDAGADVKMRDALWLYSPLLRTKQTFAGVLVGAKLAGSTEVRSRPDTRLFERSAGSLTNLTWDEAAQVWPEMKKGRQASVFNQASAAYPNGESLEMVYRRASASIDEALASERRVIVIAHELTIKTLVAHLTKGMIDDSAFAFKVENAKAITLLRKDGKWVISP